LSAKRQLLYFSTFLAVYFTKTADKKLQSAGLRLRQTHESIAELRFAGSLYPSLMYSYPKNV
jgi:hypothetical protein